MPASKKYLHPETLARISRLELRARRVVEGFLSGRHRSRYFGQSVEFLSHRAYSPGDELRHVDWKVWARHDRLVVKQFEADTNLVCQLLVDVSHSMSYGRAPWSKFDCAATLAASVAALALDQGDAVGLTTFDAGVRATLPPRARHTQLDAVVELFDRSQPTDGTNLQSVLQAAAEAAPRRSLMVLVSDLFVDRPGLFQGLRLLRQHGHDVLVWHILDDDELDFPFRGQTQFVGLEREERLNCNPRALRHEYLRALENFLDEVRRGCAQQSIDYALFRTSAPLGGALAAFLNARRARRGRPTGPSAPRRSGSTSTLPVRTIREAEA